MKSLGICVGASTVSVVELRSDNGKTEVMHSSSHPHEGKPFEALSNIIRKLHGTKRLKIAATGRKFSQYLNLTSISEPEAVEKAFDFAVLPNCACSDLISAGAETIMLYSFDKKGRIKEIRTGNKCASGTGEFYVQQLRRLGLELRDLKGLHVSDDVEPYKVSGRCSVFCKSDCTHALNKGIPRKRVLAGLGEMASLKCLELFRGRPPEVLALVGGCTKNPFIIRSLKEYFKELYIPAEAPCFEALGAALYALENECLPLPEPDSLFTEVKSVFSFHPPLSDFTHKVTFLPSQRARAEEGDEVIIGMDAGSTTTKGVVLRIRDKAILASEYLRTLGDPVAASMQVYTSLASQISARINVRGLGVTGSGRRIVGLHAETEGVINEIIAHATAAIHFDSEVDTIFEIGGQDSKYTYIVSRVPCDYAMNEACGAGTGSFLEESAGESLNIGTEDIGALALGAQTPPNFSDQCAAFIGSDIKNAVLDGISIPDVAAGLVYSIAMNYSNRVKGNRPVGRKVFMQGGVCHNSAVPVAMAAVTGKDVVVPPEPGLMGAYGVALEVMEKIENGLMEEKSFDLKELSVRPISHKKPFICPGVENKCDIGCEISRIVVNAKTYPFGGACDRYYNLIHKRPRTERPDLVSDFERRVFRDYLPEVKPGTPTVGFNRSFLMNSLFPLFHRFFTGIGFQPVLPDKTETEGIERRGAAFCRPAEIAHGMMYDLVRKNPDYFFLPHISHLHTVEPNSTTRTCVLLQGEPFYLRSAFSEIPSKRLLTPSLDFSGSTAKAGKALLNTAKKLGVGTGAAARALEDAFVAQEEFQADIKKMGREMLTRVEEGEDDFAVVIFGRPYNAFAKFAYMGIPAKFATRGVTVIPCDALPFDGEEIEGPSNMYWGTGQKILKAATFTRRHPKLFAAYITNFSCGPDSFLIGFFRDTMGEKPSLVLEIDGHTADAGLDTRIEAFLDIIAHYIRLKNRQAMPESENRFVPAALKKTGETFEIWLGENNERIPLTDPRVKVVLPSMGRWGAPLVAEAFKASRINAIALPQPDEEALQLGRGQSSCKECLPLQTTVGSLLKHIRHRPKDEVTVYFMPETDGPCRFGQYNIFIRRMIQKLRIPDATVMSPSSEDGYAGMVDRSVLAAYRGIVLGDMFNEAYSTVIAAAADPEGGLDLLRKEHEFLKGFIIADRKDFMNAVSASAARLSSIRLKRPYHEIPKITLTGEIYVRHDSLSLSGLIENFASYGFIVRTSQVAEWLKYTDYLATQNPKYSPPLSFWIKKGIKAYNYREITSRFSTSGLVYGHAPKIRELFRVAEKHISRELQGEAILTVGAAILEIFKPACGIISIGPFGCMPSRLAEAILTEKLTGLERKQAEGILWLKRFKTLEDDEKLPFLAIETDGGPFPQLTQARIEAFRLKAMRLHEEYILKK